MKTKSICINSHGASLLELAVLLPVLLLILGGGFEFTMLLRTKQNLSNLAYLTGEAAFRACANLIGTNSDTYKGCFSNFLQSNSGVTNAILPGTDIIISLYESNGVTPPPPGQNSFQITAKKLGQFPPNNVLMSAYNASKVSGAVRGISPNNPRVLIAEFRYRYKPHFPIFKSLLGNYVIRETGIY